MITVYGNTHFIHNKNSWINFILYKKAIKDIQSLKAAKLADKVADLCSSLERVNALLELIYNIDWCTKY